jgi:SAM-dependent methyltransferase
VCPTYTYRVLEVGFGSGHGLLHAYERCGGGHAADDGRVFGVEISDLMLAKVGN